MRGESEAARVSACAILLDRGWGKAEQVHSGDIQGDITITIRKILDIDEPKLVNGKEKTNGKDKPNVVLLMDKDDDSGD